MNTPADPAFTFTCPDCHRGGEGWTNALDLVLHLRAEHAGEYWTEDMILAEAAEQETMCLAVHGLLPQS